MREEQPICGIAFDLDGILTDSAPGLTAALDRRLSEQGLPPVGLARVATWIGNGADVLVERALRCSAPPACASMSTMPGRWWRAVRYFLRSRIRLARLALLGLPMAVVTNKPMPFVAPLLASLGIERHFALIISGDDVSAQKPHPAPLYLVLGHLGLYAHELLFIGDSRNDILVAKAAGYPSAGMTCGYNYGEAITSNHLDYVLDRFADLLPVLGLSSSVNQDV